jgi:hypothetical protein
MMTVDTRSGASGLEFGIPRLLFTSKLISPGACDATSDGQRFLCLLKVESEARDNQLTVILNWRATLRR